LAISGMALSSNDSMPLPNSRTMAAGAGSDGTRDTWTSQQRAMGTRIEVEACLNHVSPASFPFIIGTTTRLKKEKLSNIFATLNMRGKKRGLFSGLVRRTKISVEFSSCHVD
jgi:hypothetical protein